MEKREKAVSLNTIGTVLSVIAAVASAYFAFRANDLMEQQTRADVLVNETPNITYIKSEVCRTPQVGAGLGLNAEHYFLSYSVEAMVKLTNNGGKPVSVIGVSVVDGVVSGGGVGHSFRGQITDVQNDPLNPVQYTAVLPVAETQVWRLSGVDDIWLGDSLEDASNAMLSEAVWSPSSLNWVLVFGDGKSLQVGIPVRRDGEVGVSLLATAHECSAVPR